jgi:hypothetical protein
VNIVVTSLEKIGCLVVAILGKLGVWKDSFVGTQ